jgi:hypothetical protein
MFGNGLSLRVMMALILVQISPQSLRLWESGALFKRPPSLERWYDVNIWGPLIDRLFLNLEDVLLLR